MQGREGPLLTPPWLELRAEPDLLCVRVPHRMPPPCPSCWPRARQTLPLVPTQSKSHHSTQDSTQEARPQEPPAVLASGAHPPPPPRASVHTGPAAPRALTLTSLALALAASGSGPPPAPRPPALPQAPARRSRHKVPPITLRRACRCAVCPLLCAFLSVCPRGP